jgi:hypothetical protein
MVEIKAGSGEAIVVALEDYEAGLLRGLIAEMRTLLRADVPRSDPVVARLFPDAYDSAPDANSFRALVGDELTEEKMRAVQVVEGKLGTSGPVAAELGRDEVDAWLTAINDIRLALGTRLEVDEERMAAPVRNGDADDQALSVLHWLGWIQELTLEHLQEGAR